MGFEIVWTKKAVKTFGKRIKYLEEHWSEKEISNFVVLVNRHLALLQSQPSMFRKSFKVKYTYTSVIIKQVSLIYRVKPSNHIVELIAFIDNRQNLKI